jgi:hypothetical protein
MRHPPTTRRKPGYDVPGFHADADPGEIQRIVDDAVGEVRAERRAPI